MNKVSPSCQRRHTSRRLWEADVVVAVVVVTSPLPRDGGTARTEIQVHAVNLINIRLGERWQPILNQFSVTGSLTTSKAD